LFFFLNIVDEEELPYSSSTAQPNEEPQPKKNVVIIPSTTVLGITKGIQMAIPEQLGENWMETSNEENVLV